MSCKNPNVQIILSPALTDIHGFTVGSKAVRVTAYGLTYKDTVTFKRVQYCSNQSGYKREGCTTFSPQDAQVSSAIDYQIGTCKPSLTPDRNTLIIPYAGSYLPVVEGNASGEVVIEVEPVEGSHFDDKEKGIEPCGFCLDEVWETTGTERCNQHFVEVEEISNCGNFRWRRTEERCGYYASVPFPIELDEDCGGCGSRVIGYLFHEAETRDPDATVEIRDCEDNLIGYAYPQAGDGHTLPIQTCEGEILGWAVNNSITAPQILNC